MAELWIENIYVSILFFGCKSIKSIDYNFFSKYNPDTLYSLPNKISTWKPIDVHSFMCSIGLKPCADFLLKNDVDGLSLLLLQREDILDCLNLKMGPALKLYAFLSRYREEGGE